MASSLDVRKLHKHFDGASGSGVFISYDSMKWSTEFTLVSDFILIVLEITLHLYGLIKGQKGSIFQLYLTVFFRGNFVPL